MISNINSLNINSKHRIQNRTHTSPSFGNIRLLPADIFVLSDDRKKVRLEEVEKNNGIIAEICETNAINSKNGVRDFKQIIITFKNEILGYITMHNNADGNSLYIGSLYTEANDNRIYKGCGTELLKSAIDESKKRGFNGKLRLLASNGADSPLAFYYKNNFVITEPDSSSDIHFDKCLNAPIHYAIENNLPIRSVLGPRNNKAYMFLDENGAKATLENERLYTKRTFEKVNEKIINGYKHSANYIQSPYSDNEYFLLIADDEAKYNKAEFVILLEKIKDKSGKKHLMIKDMSTYVSDNIEEMNFAFEALNILKEKYEFENTTISRFATEQAFDFCKKSPVKIEKEKFNLMKSIKYIFSSFENCLIE